MWIAKLIRRSLNDLDGDLERVRAKTLDAASAKAPRMGKEQVTVLNKQVVESAGVESKAGESIVSASRSER
jgi:hypothetical protein